jgi:hypothetical protein
MCWRQTLQVLSLNPNPDSAKEAKNGFLHMVTCGRDLGYDVEGEEKFMANLKKAMKDAREASGLKEGT